MGYLLSVDGGGTKTEFCIYDTETKESQYYKAGSGNFKSVGVEGMKESLREGSQWICNTFGISLSELEYAVFGMSGCDSREDYGIIQRAIEEAGYPMEKTYLCNDGVLAYFAQAQAPGIVIIAGTGSIVIGIDQEGKSERVGGWGYGFSDIGSGYWIGSEAVKYTLLYVDGCRPYSPLCDAIRRFYGAENFEELPYRITQIQDYSSIAKAAAVVVDLAEEGVGEAEEILMSGADTLAAQAASVCRKMGFSDEKLSIVCSGGVICSGDYYRKCLEKKLREYLPERQLSICQQKNTPSYGGIRLGLERLRKKNEIILQIFTGGYLENTVTFADIQKKLDTVLGRLPVKAVIIGWSLNEGLYRQVKEYLRPWKIEMYLWLPVFSENGLLKESRLMKDFRGRTVKSFHLKEGENFEFYCPSQKENRENVLEIYEEHFARVGFDGVFLDKIRYGAFSNGLSGVFSCFCETCLETYRRKGVDVEGLTAEMEKVEAGKALLPDTYRNGEYHFSAPVWDSFFEAKAEMIAESLRPITEYFRGKGMKVGMDTFAPFLGYFSGQRIERLAGQADFVKPMMYRMTKAPAGLPFEYEQFLQETARGQTAEAAARFCEAAGIDRERTEPFDPEFVRRELEYLAGQETDIYCGIEVNRIAEVAQVTPDYIEENLRTLGETGINGFVLSWDLLSAPEENIDRVVSVIGG